MELVSMDGGSIDDVLVLTEYKRDDGTILGNMVRYWCESCGYCHEIGVHRPGEQPYAGGHSWEWNGDLRQPVLIPSELLRTYSYPNDYSEDDPRFQWIRDMFANKASFETIVSSAIGHVCHTFIGINGAPPGHIIWLSDCRLPAHSKRTALCGQVRPLPPRREWGMEPGGWPENGRSWAKIAVRQ